MTLVIGETISAPIVITRFIRVIQRRKSLRQGYFPTRLFPLKSLYIANVVNWITRTLVS
jgi:hypothetical protein